MTEFRVSPISGVTRTQTVVGRHFLPVSGAPLSAKPLAPEGMKDLLEVALGDRNNPEEAARELRELVQSVPVAWPESEQG